jgi:hypothetical protein
MVTMPACERVLFLLRAAIREKNGVPCLKSSDIIAEIKCPFQSTRQLLSSFFLAAIVLLSALVIFIFLDVFVPREVL